MSPQNSDITIQKRGFSYTAIIFFALWLLLFILYFPAAKAGFVADFTGWLDQVRNHSFSEFINRTHFQARSPYQLTQLNTYIFYKLFGVNPWAWHILFITLHAFNATLLYALCKRLLDDTGVHKGLFIAVAGAVLFCVSPYISEVVVWEPSFHFLQGLLLVLVILLCTQQYIHTGNRWLVRAAGLLYLLSLFSLEIFYITPWLVLTLGVFYQLQNGKGLRKVAIFFFLPMLVMFLLRMAAYRVHTGDWISRIGSGAVGSIDFSSFSKPAKYLFHLAFLGRFFPQHARELVYHICNSPAGIILFYVIAASIIIYAASQFSKLGGKGKVASLLFTWMTMCLLLLLPLWFQSEMLVIYDRYLYFAGAFFYMLLAVLAGFITIRYVQVALLSLYALANLRFAAKVSRLWCKSAKVVSSLLHTIPDERGKTMLLLNIPQNMQGVAMIGAEKNSEYKLMHDLLIPRKPLTNTVYDVLAYNMNTPQDGAHVYVVNDSTLRVTLNQFGTWWWFETRGAYSYWTDDYKLDLKDPGHWYELTLRKPAGQYLILYNVGHQWKTVDMSRQGVDQD